MLALTKSKVSIIGKKNIREIHYKHNLFACVSVMSMRGTCIRNSSQNGTQVEHVTHISLMSYHSALFRVLMPLIRVWAQTAQGRHPFQFFEAASAGRLTARAAALAPSSSAAMRPTVLMRVVFVLYCALFVATEGATLLTYFLPSCIISPFPGRGLGEGKPQ